MIDPRWIEQNPDELRKLLERRRYAADDLDGLLARLGEARDLRARADALRAERNSASKEIGALIGKGRKSDAEARKAEVAHLGDQIADLEKSLGEVEGQTSAGILALPNLLEEDVPDGADEGANVEIRTGGRKPSFSFKPLAHFELGERLGILDFERGVKLAGSRFYSYRGRAARLERALIAFMLDTHTSRFGYEEVWVPMLVNDASMITTGQYPKFRNEYYRLEADGLSLIPTSEVPLVNLYREEIIPEEQLPIRLTAATSCFRREAGAAGKDTRGLVRVHQFQKVELVQLVHPARSRVAHEEMTKHAETILAELELPYRIILLCSGDTGASAARTYDLEVWMPGLGRWMEISSVSNDLDFQARRGLIRYRPTGPKQRPALVHTLNGSGVAAGRALAAILENYQTAKGDFEIPEKLRSYME